MNASYRIIKKSAAFLLLAALLMTCSCGSGETGAPEQTMPETAAEETTVSDEPVLPELDGEGGAFRMLIRKADTYNCDDVSVAELNGEIVNDSVFNRNMTVETKFNIVIVPNFQANTAQTAQKAVMAGEDMCDVMFDSLNLLSSLMTSGLLYDWNTLDHIDMSAKYWDSNAASQLSVKNRLYLAVSDISMNASSRARFIYFNKKIAGDYNLASPYELVYSDKWTLDSFGEMVRSVSADLNGDGKMDGSDRFGLLQEGPSFFISGAGIRLTQNNSEGIPEVAFMNEYTVDALAKIKDIISDEATTLSYEAAAKGKDTSGFAHIYNFGRSLFASDHFLFVQNGANVANQFSNMESPFGIVPNPKYSEEQEEYHHLMDSYACAMAVPITNPQTENTAVLLEYMSWLSSKTLVPAYYETTIKIKRFNDEDAPKMLDLVRASILYEISNIANMGVGDVINSAYTSGNLASVYAKKESAIAAAIEKFAGNFED